MTGFCRLIGAILMVLAGVTGLRAQDMPDLAALPVLSAPGTLPAAALSDQAAWLSVDAPGLYRLSLDGPGGLGLLRYDTPDGRSDGSDAEALVAGDGTLMRPGRIEDLLLQPGQALLVQIVGEAPRGLILERQSPLPAAVPVTDPAAPLALGPGQDLLLRPGGDLALTVTPSAPLRLLALTPPGLGGQARLEGAEIGAGGVFPLAPDSPLRLDLSAPPGVPILLRAAAAPPGLDEAEPGPTELGDLSARPAARGVLLAPDDHDGLGFDLSAGGDYDLVLRLPQGLEPNSVVHLRLQRQTDAGMVDLLAGDADAAGLLRAGLHLAGGRYLLDVTGSVSVPTPYVVGLAPSAEGVPGEPDDTADTARSLAPGQGVNGVLGPDNPAFLRFAVPVAGHLWELRGAFGLDRLTLTGPSEIALGQWQARDGGLALRLALPPGPFLAALTGAGRYAFRLSDLGPLPPDAEAEPNDSLATASPLPPGARVTGDFQADGDTDIYEIDLGAPTPLRLTLTPPDDGAVAVSLAPADSAEVTALLSPGNGPLTYDATLPAGRSLLTLRPRDPGLSGRYGVALDRIDAADPFEPAGSAALPGDGRIAGDIGGLDGVDHIFTPLPAGPGAAVFLCTGALKSFTLWTFGEEDQLVRGEPGRPVVLSWDDSTGGALDWRIEGDEVPGPYACRMAMAPRSAPPATQQASGGSARLGPGQSVAGQFATADDRLDLALDLPPGALALLSCSLPDAGMEAGSLALADALRAPALPDGSHPIIGGDVPDSLRLAPDPAQPLPQTVTCTLAGDESLLTPQAAGPAAPFTGRAREGFDPAAALAALSGGRPDWLAPVQVTNDLPVTLTLDGLDPAFRAYSRAGQTAPLRLTVTNTGPAARLEVSARILADGWRLSPAAATLDLAQGAGATLDLTLTLPPMQSPLAAPAVQIIARTASKASALTSPVTLDPDAADRGPAPFWTAPPALLGGLDPMRFAMGGRLVALDGQPVEPGQAADWAFLHDDDAPDSALPARLRARQAVFRLGEPAPIAGFFLRLRGQEPRAIWPDRLALELSPDGQSWTRVAEVAPAATGLTQVFSLPAPMQAGWARLTRFGCRADPGCDGVALADIGLIATPAWRPAAPPDIADPALGGHVVAGLAPGGTTDDELVFGGAWNEDLLTAQSPRALLPASPERGDRAVAILAFARNRAARIANIGWEVLPEDIGRPMAPARVEASLSGPAGPWTPLGTLSPPTQAGVARLTLPSPQWARALRLTFPRDAGADLALPDRILVTEDPAAPSVLGLWEDDRPDAGFEATTAATPDATGETTAGHSAAEARPLRPGQTVQSSVEIERNADFWALTVPDGPPQVLTLAFAGDARPDVRTTLLSDQGAEIALTRSITDAGGLDLSTTLAPGRYTIRISEPPRSSVLLWDTSGSVEEYLPAILSAVPAWALSLQPGRDRMQLLPFGATAPLLPDFAETPEAVAPALAGIGPEESSDGETALGLASDLLADQDGMRGVVIVTDAETRQAERVWAPLLAAHPRVVALSIDSSDPAGVRIMRDWATVDHGLFFRVDGHQGMADAMAMAAAIFRAPKSYRMTADLRPLAPGEDLASLSLADLSPTGLATPDPAAAAPQGAIEVILDASGSMLQRLPDGTRKIAAAQSALAALVSDDLPAGLPFAFRRFGLAPGSCDSQLDLPLGPLDPAVAAPLLSGVPAVNRARTAIAASLAAAAEDLAAVTGPRQVVLMTDGEETCGGDVPATLQALRDRGIDLRLTIVGFALDDPALAQDFAAWAMGSGGQFLPAAEARDLGPALARAARPHFLAQALDATGRPSGPPLPLDPGQTLRLAPGAWRVIPGQSAVGASLDLTLAPASALALTYSPTSGLAILPGKD